MKALTLTGTKDITVPWKEFIHALAWTESENNPNAIGAKDERGAWQLTSVAWLDVNQWRVRKDLPQYDFSSATDPVIAEEYASQFLSLLVTRLERHIGKDPSVQQLWCAWNMGLTAFKNLNWDINAVPDSTKRGIARLEEWLLEHCGAQES